MDTVRKAIETLVRSEHLISRALPEDDERLRRALGPGHWSPAEHALHCALVSEATAEGFRRALAARPLGPPPTDLVKSMARRFVLVTWRIPGGVPAPAQVLPLVILPREVLLARLLAARDQLIALTDHVDLPRRELWLEHPALGRWTSMSGFVSS